jgi:hypothetical protein
MWTVKSAQAGTENPAIPKRHEAAVETAAPRHSLTPGALEAGVDLCL